MSSHNFPKPSAPPPPPSYNEAVNANRQSYPSDPSSTGSSDAYMANLNKFINRYESEEINPYI